MTQPTHGRRRLATLAAVAALTAVLPATLATHAAADVPNPSDATSLGLKLPPPTGPHLVGSRSDFVSDPSRIDADTGQPRELPVRVWYPAKKNSRGLAAPYASPVVQAELEKFTGAAPGAFNVDTHAVTGAAPRSHPRGVLLLAPGGGSITAFQTGLVIDLVSHGYTVVAVEIPHESFIVELSDGTVIRQSDASPYPFREWRLDAQAVLDNLTRLVPQARRETPVGMFGHSRGGAATIDTLFHDSRVTAGVSLDTGGILFGDDVTPPSEVVTAGLDQPLGLTCSIGFPCTTTPYLIDFLPRLRGAHPVLDLPVLHNGYTDFVVFNAQAAQVDRAVAEVLETGFFDTGTLDDLSAGKAAMRAERDFLANFFDRYLDKDAARD
jgi:hypothetical protein